MASAGRPCVARRGCPLNSERAVAVATALTCASLTLCAPSRACEERSEPLAVREGIPTPFDRLGCNLLDAATGENLLFYGAAILSTVELSATFADHDVRVAFETTAQSRAFSDAMIAFGYAGLPSIGALLYGTGLVRGDRSMSRAGAAAIQAMAVTITTTVLLKLATGRPYPNHGGDPHSPDRLVHPEWSREWNGPSSGNTAWPSGHASVAMSLASSLTAYWIDAPWVGYLAYPAAAAVGIGVVSGADHWLSDVVAGALIGHAVGWSIGSDFRRMQNAHDASRSRGLQVGVVPLPGTTGLAVVGTF